MSRRPPRSRRNAHPFADTTLFRSLVVGAVLVVLARRRRRAPATLAAVLLVGVALLLGPAAAAPAEAVDCVAADNSLTVTQTSTMAGLAPGVAPEIGRAHV